LAHAAFSSGDASRKNSKAEPQKRMDLQWVAEEIKNLARLGRSAVSVFFCPRNKNFASVRGEGKL
jgi:serine/threonine-protein kinase RIO1